MPRQEALFPEVTPSSEVHSSHLEVDAPALGSFQAKVQQKGWVLPAPPTRDLQRFIPALVCKMRKQRWWTLESERTRLGF